MSKTLIYRLFGIGRIPRFAVAQLSKEGVLLQDEGIHGSVTFTNFRAPGKYANWKRTWFSGSIVLTREHLLVFKYCYRLVNIPWSDSRLNELKVELDGENSLTIAFDLSSFNRDTSGQCKVKLRTPLAREIVAEIQRRAVRE